MPPVASATRIASSIALFSWSLTVNPTKRPSMPWASSVSRICPDESGTRLTQTRTFVIQRIRSLSGSSTGVASADSIVTGYSSSM